MSKYCGISSEEFAKYLRSYKRNSKGEILLNHEPVNEVKNRSKIIKKLKNGKFSVGTFFNENGKIVFEPYAEIWFEELLFYRACGIKVNGPKWLDDVRKYDPIFDEKYCIGSSYGEHIDAPIRLLPHCFSSSTPWLDHPISQWY